MNRFYTKMRHEPIESKRLEMRAELQLWTALTMPALLLILFAAFFQHTILLIEWLVSVEM